MKVTVVCLCYNHRPFVGQAISSVLSQTHDDVQLIVIDDGSTDGSQDEIRNCIAGNSSAQFLNLEMNIGYCRAFNRALPFIKGDFVIDLSGDDVLLPDRALAGIRSLTLKGPEYGIHFSDAEYIDRSGRHLYDHSDKYPHASIPEGDIYRELIRRYFICSPSMMFRSSVLHQLGGYDESLAYEDFDFWIRTSRMTKYCYTPNVLVRKRVIPGSLRSRQFSRKHDHANSTLMVCRKILSLNKAPEEDLALLHRVYYEIRASLRRMQFELALRYLRLAKELRHKSSIVNHRSS